MDSYGNKFFVLTAIASALSGATTAIAQENTKLALEEIVVTASKREERLLDVPMSIATMTGLELESRGIDTIQDLSFAIPGLTMREDGPGSYQVFLRGIANAYGGGALVSIYQDEIPMVLTGYEILPTRILDIKRIEVLKGPQGTLYGQGALGGAIRYITNDPVLGTFEGSLEGEAYDVSGGDLGTSIKAIVNVPMGDKFAMRVATNFRDGGGWQDQPEAGIEDGNGEDLEYIRVKALWAVTDKLEILASYNSYNAEYELGQGYEQPDRTVFVAIDPSLALTPKVWEYDLYNVEINFDLGFANLLSSTSYVDMDTEYPSSYFGGPETVYRGILEGYSNRHSFGDQFTQELRLTSAGDGAFQWTLGGFYRDMAMNLEIPLGATEYAGDVSFYEYSAEGSSESYSIFADVSYQLTEKLEVGVGARYFDDEQTESIDGAPEQSGGFDSFDPRVYVSYTLSEDASLYASVAKGFRSGGFNGFDPVTLEEFPGFDPEELWSYEIGYKANMLDGALYFDVAAYYTEYDNMLRRGLVFISPELGFQSLISNIGEVEVMGIEASLTWQATESLSFTAAGTVIDAEITKLETEGSANIEGDAIDYVPDFSFTLGALYDFNWTADMPGFIRLGYSYRDELPYIDRTSFPDENVPQYSDKVGLLDFRMGIRRDNIYAELYSQNLTNENKYIDPYAAWNNANRTRPRVVGVKLGVDF